MCFLSDYLKMKPAFVRSSLCISLMQEQGCRIRDEIRKWNPQKRSAELPRLSFSLGLKRIALLSQLSECVRHGARSSPHPKKEKDDDCTEQLTEKKTALCCHIEFNHSPLEFLSQRLDPTWVFVRRRGLTSTVVFNKLANNQSITNTRWTHTHKMAANSSCWNRSLQTRGACDQDSTHMMEMDRQREREEERERTKGK